MTTATLAMTGQAVAPAGGQFATGGVGSAVGEVRVNMPDASGPLMAADGTAVAHPVTLSGFRDTG